jgi:hypothetical protein
MKEWIIARLSNEVDANKLIEALQTLWILASSMKKITDEKLAFVKVMAKTKSGVSIVSVSTSCNRKGCYCRGKPLHSPYLKLYKGSGKYEGIGKDPNRLRTFLAQYIDENDVDDILSISFLRAKVLKIYSRLGEILAELGVVEK